MYIEEQSVNKTENCLISESEIYESFTEDIGKLFKDLQKIYGRCTDKVYVDDKTQEHKHIGWIFEKKICYEDFRYSPRSQRKYYLQETWISLHDKKPETTITNFYHEL